MPDEPTRLRFQISLTKTAARMWATLAKSERRNKSNMLEVLIEQAHKARKARA